MQKAVTLSLPIAERREPERRPGMARRYNLLLALLLLPPLAVLLVTSMVLEPLQGDLTRIGGYPENKYGWTDPQVRFDPPLTALDYYASPYDVVVLGDSFSSDPYGTGQTDAGVYWPNHLAQRTGLSVLTLNLFKHGLMDVLENPNFKAHPPRVVVLQAVESVLGLYFAKDSRGYLGTARRSCSEPARSTARALDIVSPRPATTAPWVRDRSGGFALDQSVSFLWKTLQRDSLGYDRSGVHNLALTRGDLFSSEAPDRLLVHERDLLKANWSEATVAAFRCNLIEAQNQVESNGQTRFLLMVVPDKLTIYEDYLVDTRFRRLSRLPGVFGGTGLHVVDLLSPLRRAVLCPVVDLYLPNDTHWNSLGHAIAADAVLRALGVGSDPDAAAIRPTPESCTHVS